MSTNIIEQKPQEIDSNHVQPTESLLAQSLQDKISQPSDTSYELSYEDSNKEPKRALEVQSEQQISGQPCKKVKLSVQEEVRKKIENFRPFTRAQNIKSLHNNGNNQTHLALDPLTQPVPTAKFQVIKGTFIISISLINKQIHITAQSRIDQAFILQNSITKQDIPQSLKKSGYTLASQVFNQMSKNKDYLQINPLMNLKIVIIEQRGRAQMMRKFRFPLAQKTLSFEEQYMKKMRMLQEENHRLQYQLSEVAMGYEEELEQQRKRADCQRAQKQQLLKQLQQYRKIDIQDLQAKSTIDLAGFIQINDRQKYRPVVAIQQQVQQVNPQFVINNQLMNAPVVDIEKLTLEKNYTDEVKNKDHLKMLEMVQKLGQNSTKIDKNFLSLIIDVILNEDKKRAKQKQCELDQIEQQPIKPYEKPIDISVYSKNFIKGNFKAPQPPQVQILTPPKPIIPQKKQLISQKQDPKAQARRLKAEEKKKKLKDHKVQDENKQKAQKQLAEFLGFSFSAKNDVKQVVEKDKKSVEEEKKLKDKYFGQFQARKQNNNNEKGTAIELEEKPLQIVGASSYSNFVNQQNTDDEIQLIEDPELGSQMKPKPHPALSVNGKKPQQLPQSCQVVQLPQTPQSRAIAQNKNKQLAQIETDSIQILDLDNPNTNNKNAISLQDDIFMNVRPPSTTTNPNILHQRRNQPFSRPLLSSVYPKQPHDISITKVIPRKSTQPKPLILNHTYKGLDPGLSRQQQSELLDANMHKRMRPRLPKVYQTIDYSDKRQVWKDYAQSLQTNDLTLLLNEQNYGNVHKIFKMDKLIGTMAWVELFYKLRVLDLTKNNITYIEGLTNLKYLQKLDLSQNLITKIQNLQGQLNMRELHLRENKIELIQNIFHMKKLDTLGLQANCIFEINDSLGKIQALRYLYLQNNRIKKLKPSLKNLRLMGFMIYGNGMNYDDPANKDVLNYVRSTYCNVHTEEFLAH